MEHPHFKDIAFKGIFYSDSLKEYYVSSPCRIDGGATRLGKLFGYENEMQGIEDILTSNHFINKIKEEYWERDWCLIGSVQYTGLKDKNGVEIYEGDIVKSYSNKYDSNMLVEYNTTTYGFDCYYKQGYSSSISLWGASAHNLEVIGNIYENKELLNEN